jgi:hypothetical protein
MNAPSGLSGADLSAAQWRAQLASTWWMSYLGRIVFGGLEGFLAHGKRRRRRHDRGHVVAVDKDQRLGLEPEPVAGEWLAPDIPSYPQQRLAINRQYLIVRMNLISMRPERGTEALLPLTVLA